MDKYYVAKLHECPRCNGSGQVKPFGWQLPDDKPTIKSLCSVCLGAGKLPEWIPLRKVFGEYWFDQDVVAWREEPQ